MPNKTSYHSRVKYRNRHRHHDAISSQPGYRAAVTFRKNAQSATGQALKSARDQTPTDRRFDGVVGGGESGLSALWVVGGCIEAWYDKLLLL